MRRWIVAALVVTGLAGCATPAPGSSSSAPAAAPVIDCLGGLDQATCDIAVKVVLDTVAHAGWTPTHVWINSGSLVPSEELLFDPKANFPAPNVPDGGMRLGNAEVAFVETDKHAGMNLSAVGQAIVADLIGYAVPEPDWCSGACPSASSTDGSFRLELVLPRTEWKADEPLTGTAILSFDGSGPTKVYGSGSVLNFAYAEVGGTRRVEPVWTADCATHDLDPATPITKPVDKSGAASDGGPDTAWLHSFIVARDVRLPAGTWDVTALAIFTECQGCAGAGHSIEATVRVTVTD